MHKKKLPADIKRRREVIIIHENRKLRKEKKKTLENY